jgi:hypothetical protein
MVHSTATFENHKRSQIRVKQRQISVALQHKKPLQSALRFLRAKTTGTHIIYLGAESWKKQRRETSSVSKWLWKTVLKW